MNNGMGTNWLAEQIALQYSIPIPLVEIVSEEEIKLTCDDYGKDTFDGLTVYERENDCFYIHLNTANGNRPDSTKGRFTLAHELGHYFIDHHRIALINGVMQPHCHTYNPFGNNETWIIEREADDFASSLLMPWLLLKQDLLQEKFSGTVINRLSKRYKVSFSAMAIRCLKCDYTPMMLVYAVDGMVKWQLHSKDFPFWQLKHGKALVPENSVMGEYFNHGDDSDCRNDEIVFAGDCFHTFSQEQNNLKFYEYCIPYKNKAFSMFWQKD